MNKPLLPLRNKQRPEKETKRRLIFQLASCTGDFTQTLKWALSHSTRLTASVKQRNTVNRALAWSGCGGFERNKRQKTLWTSVLLFPFLNKGLELLTKFCFHLKTGAYIAAPQRDCHFHLWHFSLNPIGHGDNETIRGRHCKRQIHRRG